MKRHTYLPFNAFFMRYVWPITKADMTLDEVKKYEVTPDEQEEQKRPSRGRRSNPWSWS